jgi:hypothetical protein
MKWPKDMIDAADAAESKAYRAMIGAAPSPAGAPVEPEDWNVDFHAVDASQPEPAIPPALTDKQIDDKASSWACSETSDAMRFYRSDLRHFARAIAATPPAIGGAPDLTEAFHLLIEAASAVSNDARHQQNRDPRVKSPDALVSWTAIRRLRSAIRSEGAAAPSPEPAESVSAELPAIETCCPDCGNRFLVVRSRTEPVSDARLREALENYMAAFGQGLQAHGIPFGPQQIEADEQARAALTAPTTAGDKA